MPRLAPSARSAPAPPGLLVASAFAAITLADVAHPSTPIVLAHAGGASVFGAPLAGYAAPVVPPHLQSPGDGPVEAPAAEPRPTMARPIAPRGLGPAVAAAPPPATQVEVRPPAPDGGGARYLRGLEALSAGRGRDAARHFAAARPVLGPSLGDELAYSEAEAAFVAGDLLTARKAFVLFLTRHGDSPWAPRVRFRVADIDFALGDHARAQTAYEDLLVRYPEYPGTQTALLAIARCLEGRGRGQAAAARFRDVALAGRDPAASAQAERALERLAAAGVVPRPMSDAETLELGRNLSYWKRWPEAEVRLGPLVAALEGRRAPADQRAEAHYWRGRNFFAWERYENALIELSAAQDAGAGGRVHPWLAQTYERLGRVPEAAALYARRLNGASLDERLHDMYFDEGLYRQAEAHLNRLLAARRSLTGQHRYRWRRAWLAYRLGRLDEAAAAFLAESNRGGASRWKARYWLARTYERLGRPDDARREYRAVTSAVRIDYYSVQADNRLRDLDGPGGRERPGEPVASYGDPAAGALAPPDPRAPPARTPTARQSEAARDRKLVDSLALAEAPAPPPGLPVGLDRAGARVEWAEPATADAGATVTGPGAEGPDGDGRVAPPADPFATTTSPLAPPEGPAATFDRLVERYADAAPSLVRVRDLAALGQWWQVRHALEALLQEHREVRRNGTGRNARLRAALGASTIDHRTEPRGAWGAALDPASVPADVLRIDPARRRKLARLGGPFLRDLGDAFAHAGAPHYAKRYMLLADEHLRAASDGGPGERALWARAYPRAYEDLMRRHAAELDVPPYLMWAVMTVESSHYAGAVSRADARGLMQVIPKTGYLVSRLMGLQGFTPAQLAEPEYAVRFGCWYMGQLLEKFRGQEPLAIAAYNGGPHNVAYWLKRKGSLPLDEFVEEMRFDEAREYTKKVLKFVRLYLRIWQGRSDVYVSNDLNPNYRDNINF